MFSICQNQQAFKTNPGRGCGGQGTGGGALQLTPEHGCALCASNYTSGDLFQEIAQKREFLAQKMFITAFIVVKAWNLTI